mgnify:CR=1 FL=1
MVVGKGMLVGVGVLCSGRECADVGCVMGQCHRLQSFASWAGPKCAHRAA